MASGLGYGFLCLLLLMGIVLFLLKIFKIDATKNIERGSRNVSRMEMNVLPEDDPQHDEGFESGIEPDENE